MCDDSLVYPLSIMTADILTSGLGEPHNIIIIIHSYVRGQSRSSRFTLDIQISVTYINWQLGKTLLQHRTTEHGGWLNIGRVTPVAYTDYINTYFY